MLGRKWLVFSTELAYQSLQFSSESQAEFIGQVVKTEGVQELAALNYTKPSIYQGENQQPARDTVVPALSSTALVSEHAVIVPCA